MRARCRTAILAAAFGYAGLVQSRPPASAADFSFNPCANHAGASASQAEITVDGRRRTYLVAVRTHVAARRWPVVFAFHGRGETPELLANYSGLSRLPAVVVYPRGLPGRGGKLSWSGTPAAASGVDDVRFVEAVLARLEQTSCVDPKRIYATGKSDGGGLAAQLACKAADRFAAIAPVAGAYYPVAGGCRPARAIAVLEIHGTADRVVPYTGSPRRRLPNVHAWLSAWSERDGCTDAARPHAIAAGVTQERWNGCRDGTVVEGDRIAGGGHTWPGALAPSGPGMTSAAIDATAVIGSFFGVLPQESGTREPEPRLRRGSCSHHRVRSRAKLLRAPLACPRTTLRYDSISPEPGEKAGEHPHRVDDFGKAEFARFHRIGHNVVFNAENRFEKRPGRELM